MRKSKRNPVQIHEWKELWRKSYLPKNPAFLPQVIEAYETAIRNRLNQEEKRCVIKLIDAAVEQHLRFAALEDAMLPRYDTQARVRGLIGLIKKLLQRLNKASCDEAYELFEGKERDFYDFMDLLSDMIALHEAREANRKANRLKDPPIDPKLLLLLHCRYIIHWFDLKWLGLTNDGRLTRFATAVFKYATGMDEGFERQVRKIPIFEKYVRSGHLYSDASRAASSGSFSGPLSWTTSTRH